MDMIVYELHSPQPTVHGYKQQRLLREENAINLRLKPPYMGSFHAKNSLRKTKKGQRLQKIENIHSMILALKIFARHHFGIFDIVSFGKHKNACQDKNHYLMMMIASHTQKGTS